MFTIYEIIMQLLGRPLGSLWLRHRAARGKEDISRLGERWGVASQPRPHGPVIWLHGASVGECLSVLPLVKRLLQDHAHCQILVTSGTLTSARLVADRFPPQVIHQFLPFDEPRSVEGFLDHWRPNLILWTESELWPVMLKTAAQRSIPIIGLNMRLSQRSLQRWMGFPGSFQKLLTCFSMILPQTQDLAQRLWAFVKDHPHPNSPSIQYVGNLKFAFSPATLDPHEAAQVAQLIQGRPAWLAASTHPGEEQEIFKVHQQLKAMHGSVLTIIAPRHPHRMADLLQSAEKAQLTSICLSDGLKHAPQTDLFWIDRIGALNPFYAQKPPVFVGGSLVPHGGHNPIEPAYYGAPVLYGPHMHHFQEICGLFDQHQASQVATDATALAQALTELWAHPQQAQDLAHKGQHLVQQEAQVLDHVMQALEPYIQNIEDLTTHKASPCESAS
jgi:3-deoxy-D-manno-octulosonic-acid transferase